MTDQQIKEQRQTELGKIRTPGPIALSMPTPILTPFLNLTTATRSLR